MPDKNKKKKYSGVSAIFWVVFALILLILFLVNRNRIYTVLQTTGFFTKVFGTEPEFLVNFNAGNADEKPVAELESLQSKNVLVEEPNVVVLTVIGQEDKKSGDGQSQQNTASTADEKKTSADSQKTQNQTAEKEETTASTSADQNTGNTQTASGKADGTAATQAQTQSSQNTQPVATMQQHLCFIEISGDGSVLRREVVRTISKTTTPLTAAMNALLTGPGLDEIEKGYISLIPQGTKLLGASVKNGTATINFSDTFRYNQYGVEGYYGQLMQIVYTATAFSNIDNVQFLIEGEKMDYLGLEGVYIGAPLSTASFH